MKMVVKVQRPVVTNDPAKLALVYAKNHHGVAQQKLDYATVKAMGDDLKAFFEAELRHTGQWSIGKRVRDRKW